MFVVYTEKSSSVSILADSRRLRLMAFLLVSYNADRFYTAAHIHLAEQVVDVGLYRTFRNEQFICDLGVGLAVVDLPQDLHLPFGQLKLFLYVFHGCIQIHALRLLMEIGFGEIPFIQEHDIGDIDDQPIEDGDVHHVGRQMIKDP